MQIHGVPVYICGTPRAAFPTTILGWGSAGDHAGSPLQNNHRRILKIRGRAYGINGGRAWKPAPTNWIHVLFIFCLPSGGVKPLSLVLLIFLWICAIIYLYKT